MRIAPANDQGWGLPSRESHFQIKTASSFEQVQNLSIQLTDTSPLLQWSKVTDANACYEVYQKVNTEDKFKKISKTTEPFY